VRRLASALDMHTPVRQVRLAQTGLRRYTLSQTLTLAPAAES